MSPDIKRCDYHDRFDFGSIISVPFWSWSNCDTRITEDNYSEDNLNFKCFLPKMNMLVIETNFTKIDL